VELASEDDDYAAITEEPEADFHNLAAVALDNAGIDTVAQVRTARKLADTAAAAPRNSIQLWLKLMKTRSSTRSHLACWMLDLSQKLYPPTFKMFNQFSQRIQINLMQWRTNKATYCPSHKITSSQDELPTTGSGANTQECIGSMIICRND
jgi:hypothetical protein